MHKLPETNRRLLQVNLSSTSVPLDRYRLTGILSASFVSGAYHVAEIEGEHSSDGNDRAVSDSNGPVFIFEDFELHSETYELLHAGRSTGLQLKPSRLLLYLIEHRERTVPKEELLDAIWPGRYVGETAFTTAVGEVRRALLDDGDTQRLIRTFRGRGYRFVGTVERRCTDHTSEDAAKNDQRLPKPVQVSRRVRQVFAVAGLALLVLIAALVSWHQATETPPDKMQSLAFEKRDWVLISSFENETGEPLLDNTLEHALERMLVNSRFVKVVPRGRVQDTLRLMKQPADARVDVELGREICLRDGAIRALITGRAEKSGTTYILSVGIVDPAQGVTVAHLSEQAQDEDQIWPAILRLASGVRETLGEDLSLIRLSESKLAKVTTPSLTALRLYSEADSVINLGPANNRLAEQLLKQALAEDPEFASAYIHLAWALANQNRGKDEYLEPAERAWELAGTASDRERYFIQGSYHDLQGQHKQAVASYQTLLRVYPNHYWGTANLVGLYRRLGRFEESVPYVLRLAELRPNSFSEIVAAAQARVRWGDNRAQAEPYLQRARALLSPDAEKGAPWQAAWVRLFHAHTLWLRGEMEATLGEVARVRDTAKSRSGLAGRVLARNVADTYLTLGKLRAAEELYQSFPETPLRHYQLSIVAVMRGDEAALWEHLLRASPTHFKAAYLARAGHLAEAEKTRQASFDFPGAQAFPVCAAGYSEFVRGEIALARGKTAEAVRLFEDGLGVLRLGNGCSLLMTSESLAKALEQQGEWQRALRVLEEAAMSRKAVYSTFMSSVAGAPWIRNQFQRAGLLRKLGREPQAREIETELRKLLAYADADHVIARALHRLGDQEEV